VRATHVNKTFSADFCSIGRRVMSNAASLLYCKLI